MAAQLVPFEPIPPPDVRRPAKLSLLPHWVEERLTVLQREQQPDQTGRRREVPVLPKSLILGKEQKMVVERHVAGLAAALDMTPEASPEHAEVTMLAVSKMMLVLAGKDSGDFVGEAKGEAYMDALEDVPSWAVREAMRKWHRGECGSRHDYRWQPGPSVLRDLAMIETYRVMATRRKLTDLLLAEPLLEFSDEHRAAMKAKLSAANLRSMQ